MTALRVVELAQGVSGPLCGRLFAGFGHDVLKCEPPGGDRQRSVEPLGPDGVSFSFAVLNQGKRSAGLTAADYRSEVEVLLDGADVVIADFSAAAAVALGWDEATVAGRWPQLVWVSVTGFGLHGALSGLPNDSMLAEAYGGLAYLVGDPGRSPLSLGGEQAAYAAGFVAYLGARLALLRRQHTGRGDLIDVASTDLTAFMDWKSDVAVATSVEVPVRNATTGWWRILPAADGFVGMLYHDSDWPRLVRLVGDERLADPRYAVAGTRVATISQWLPIVADWIAARPARQVYEQAQRAGLPFGYSADMAELARDMQYQARGFLSHEGGRHRIGPPWHITGIQWKDEALAPERADVAWLDPDQAARGDAPRAPGTEPGAAPLAGLVVLDLGTITAGAAAGRLLADYGATVIKVENPDHPDPFRKWAEASGQPTETSPLFQANNAGKLAVSVDLKSGEGQAALRRLAASADILVENFRVGVTERLAITFQELHDINPRLIYLSLASQGQDGPEARYSSYGSTLDLISGLSSITGYRDGPPVWSSYLLNYPDQVASVVGAALVVHCIAEGVRGTHIDLSQRELVTWTLSDLLIDQLVSGTTAQRTGNRRGAAMPHDIYRCAGQDRWVAVACFSDTQRAALSRLVGASIAPVDPDAADEAITRWTAARQRDECVAALTAVGVPNVPVLDARDRANETHFTDRRVFVDGPGGVRMRGFPFVMRNFRPGVPTRAPGVGEHNAQLLS
jgi:crotonobetainyl-CoA:carnitine CoA-transferase CaiB-like acyl-CoA transferase